MLISIILHSMLGMESGLFASTTLDCCIPFFLLHILAMPRDANFWGSKMWRLPVFYPPPPPPCPYCSGNLGHYIKSCINYILSKCSIIVLMQDIIFVSDQIGAKCCRNLTMIKKNSRFQLKMGYISN